LRGVQLAGRGVLPADVVLVGVGALPNDELARAAGLPCDDGILVDEAMRTADPLIHAAGDCTRHPSAYAGRHIRLESVQNAIDQGHAAALAMLGRPEPAARVPWFWSQQFDLKLQTAGLPGGHDRIEHAGEPAAGRFALRYYRGERLLAVDAINLPGEYLQARKALTRQLEAQLAPRAEPAHARPADANALQTP
jgi:3-phenylpropionate/trans-cinnamate dioxygenase ferredoxin reductase subunit